MIYVDHGATSYPKPAAVSRAVLKALQTCANPGRGGHSPSMAAARAVYACRERAGELFECQPEQVVLTNNCTHGLNIAIHTLVKPGSRVVISGFEHNAVTRPLYTLDANVTVAGRRLFDWEDTLTAFEKALQQGQNAAIFTHVSNVFGYILPVEEMAALCRQYSVPFVVDAAQSAGSLPVSLDKWGADFIAMPGHKGLLGPQGTGLLLCSKDAEPLLQGGTGGNSISQNMPRELPERLEAGTVNVPGAAGLEAGMAQVQKEGLATIAHKEHTQVSLCTEALQKMGFQVFSGVHQAGTLSFVPAEDCEELARKLAGRGVCVRAGLHCAPLAHESAGTLQTGTVRVSFGHTAETRQTEGFLRALKSLI